MKRLRSVAGRLRAVKVRLTEIGEALKPRLVQAAPDFRDLHVYGGGVIVAGGLWLSPWPWTALVAFGALALFLGLRRM